MDETVKSGDGDNIVVMGECVPSLYGAESIGGGMSKVVPIRILKSDIPYLVELKSGRIRCPQSLTTTDGKSIIVNTMVHLKNTRNGEVYALFGTNAVLKLLYLMHHDSIKTRVQNGLKKLLNKNQ